MTHVDCFDLAFKKERADGLAEKCSWNSTTPTLVNTPVVWINGALTSTFGRDCVSLEQCSTVAQEVFGVTPQQEKGNVFLDLILMDCVLQRRVPEDGSVANADESMHVPMKAYADVQWLQCAV